MSFGKELLLSCIVVMHVSSVASMPLELGMLRERMEDIDVSLCNLVEAEREYVKQMFPVDTPTKYQSNSLPPLEGITLPVGNDTEEIRASACAISDYLDNHLLTIIRNQIEEHGYLINQIKAFHIQFKAAVEPRGRDPEEHTRCHRNVTKSHAYEMKVFGIRIIYFARKWVEDFTNTTLSCNLNSDN